MRLRTLLSVYAVLLGVGGVVALLIPEISFRLYGVEAPDRYAMWMYRLFGATSIGVALIAWLARNAAASPVRDGLVLGLTVMNGLTAIVTFLAVRALDFNVTAWLPVVSYAVFTVLFAIAGRAGMTPKPAAGGSA